MSHGIIGGKMKAKFVVNGEPREEWRDVVGNDGYYKVSNHGRVVGKKGTILNPYITGKGYKTGDGYSTVKINRRNQKVHRMVAEAFIPNPSGLPQVNHRDGDKSNNFVNNLEWCTPSDNAQHAIKAGLFASGEKSPFSKLTYKDVEEIRTHYQKGCSLYGVKPLSRMYGVSSTTIRNILKGKKWRCSHAS
jgi:hypothetical protein